LAGKSQKEFQQEGDSTAQKSGEPEKTSHFQEMVDKLEFLSKEFEMY
jgi:hypothetical protein